MGSRLHGNDGGVSWLPTPRRGGRVSNPPLREPVEGGSHPHPRIEYGAGFALSRRGRKRGPPHQVPIRRGQRADTWVRPYARRSGGAPSPPYRVRGRLRPLPSRERGERGPRTRSPFVGDSGRTRGSAPTLGGRGGTLTPVSSTGQAPGRASLAVNAGLVCGQNFAEAAGDDLLLAVAEVDGDDGDAALGPSGAQ